MGIFWPVLVLATAISIDGLSVGIAYGLRGIKMGLMPLLIISAISTFAIYLTSTLGSLIAKFINSGFAELSGSIILIFIGAWLIFQAFQEISRNEDEKLLFSVQIRSLGIIINVLKEPVTADLDHSGTINNSEALILGLALSLDAMGAGLGAGLSGFSSVFVPLLIGLITLSFVCLGFVIGDRVGDILPEHFQVFPGIVIILLGLIQLI